MLIPAQLLEAGGGEDVEPDAPELVNVPQRVVAVAPRARVKVQEVPVVVLQLLHVDVDPGHLVPVVVRRLQFNSFEFPAKFRFPQQLADHCIDQRPPK